MAEAGLTEGGDDGGLHIEAVYEGRRDGSKRATLRVNGVGLEMPEGIGEDELRDALFAAAVRGGFVEQRLTRMADELGWIVVKPQYGGTFEITVPPAMRPLVEELRKAKIR